MQAYRQGTPPVMLQKVLQQIQDVSPKEFKEVYESLPETIEESASVSSALASALPTKSLIRSLGLSPIRVEEAKAAITETVRGSRRELKRTGAAPTEYTEFTNSLLPVFKEYGAMETLRALRDLSEAGVIPEDGFKTVVGDIKKLADHQDISFTEQVSFHSPLRDRMALGGVGHFVRDAKVNKKPAGVSVDILKEDAFIDDGVFGKKLTDVLNGVTSTSLTSDAKWTSFHVSQAFHSYTSLISFIEGDRFRGDATKAKAQVNTAFHLYGLLHATSEADFAKHFAVLTETSESRLLMEQMVDVVGLKRQLNYAISKYSVRKPLDAVTEHRYEIDRTRLADPTESMDFIEQEADHALQNASYGRFATEGGTKTVQTEIAKAFESLPDKPEVTDILRTLDAIARHEASFLDSAHVRPTAPSAVPTPTPAATVTPTGPTATPPAEYDPGESDAARRTREANQERPSRLNRDTGDDDVYDTDTEYDEDGLLIPDGELSDDDSSVDSNYEASGRRRNPPLERQ
jgi:hypothetical protein